MEINSRLKKLRILMKEKGIDAYIINTADPHQSEYIADYYKGRVWISGFTGSAGTVVVTEKNAILWTDGRYFIQGEKELANSEFKLFKMRIPGFPTYSEWLMENLQIGSTIGFQGEIFSQSDFEELKKKVEEKDINFVDEVDLLGELWKDRPELPKGKVFVHELKYTGKTGEEKIEEVRNEMKKQNVDYFILSSLDDIAWLLNIRGNDVDCNPVVLSYAIVSMEETILFVDSTKLDRKVSLFLEENGVKLGEYEEVIDYIKNIDKKSRIYLDKNRINRLVYKSIPEECKIISGINITTNLKARKNPTEIENQKNAYIKDGVALVRFFHWLDEHVGKEKITEYTAQEKLSEFRSEGKDFIEPSFGTISGYKENAAMMHYSAKKETSLELQKEGMYLVDSGGQYLDGTTDITRTMVLGPITKEEKRDFTLTLKGNINLSTARFLYGATGHSLDVLSRYPLWQEGLDYKCGTGHGVGYLLNVHEGPQSFAMVINTVVLEEGMVVTIEPGVYKTGSHGVRIENVFVVKKDTVTESGQFMKFEPLSFVPIDLEGIDVDLLNEKEINWLNQYHKEVYEKLSPYINDEEKNWLRKETETVGS